MERRVARQNGWSHEQRSVYKPKAEAEQGRKGGEQPNCSFSTEDWRRKQGKPAMTKAAQGGTDRRGLSYANTAFVSDFLFFPSIEGADG